MRRPDARGVIVGLAVALALVVWAHTLALAQLEPRDFPDPFRELPLVRHNLTVSKAGAGTGTVSGTGVSCGADCAQVYNRGYAVTLTATPDGGSSFSGWSGACAGSGSCVVTMDAAKSVTATFAGGATPPWTGIIDASRAIDWSAGNQGVAGGIPTRTTICATLTSTATAVQINNAIATCPSGQVVKLGTGTFNLTAGLHFRGTSNVTLRGDGPSATKLVFTGFDGCHGATQAAICVAGSASTIALTATPIGDWTAGFTPGTTEITLSSVSGLTAGEVIVLDQCNDGKTGAACTGTPTDTGELWVCADITLCSQEGAATGDSVLNVRMQQQIVKVTNISGNVVTITPAIYMPNWRTSQNPRAWKWGTVAQTSVRNGVEDLSIDGLNSGVTTGSNITIFNAYESWVRNVRSLFGHRNHIWLYQAARSEVRNSYFYGTIAASSTSYGVEQFSASDALIVNNIFQHTASPLQVNPAAQGSVIAFNYGVDHFRTDSSMGNGQTGHAAGIALNLVEGNQTVILAHDTFHGTAHFNTYFRNSAAGYEPVQVPTKTHCTHAVGLWAFARFMNVVGNVLGTTAYHTTYQAAETGINNVVVYHLGSNNACGGAPSFGHDALVRTTLFRWGNCDAVTGFSACRFEASEVPSGLAKYANAVPGSQTLPVSFYLTAQPAWWTPCGTCSWATPKWPAVGPDVTGGNVTGVGGHVDKNPARLCYENGITPDSAYAGVDPGETVNDHLAGKPGVFNATACYAA